MIDSPHIVEFASSLVFPSRFVNKVIEDKTKNKLLLSEFSYRSALLNRIYCLYFVRVWRVRKTGSINSVKIESKIESLSPKFPFCFALYFRGFKGVENLVSIIFGLLFTECFQKYETLNLLVKWTKSNYWHWNFPLLHRWNRIIRPILVASQGRKTGSIHLAFSSPC